LLNSVANLEERMTLIITNCIIFSRISNKVYLCIYAVRLFPKFKHIGPFPRGFKFVLPFIY